MKNFVAAILLFFSSIGTAQAQDVYQTPVGILCLEGWITDATNALNRYNGNDTFNASKPYRVNRFGFIMPANGRSNFDPDNWATFGANRNQYMWTALYTSEAQYPIWDKPAYNAARVPGLRNYVRACVAAQGVTPTPAPVTPATPTPPPVPATPIPAPPAPVPAPVPAPGLTTQADCPPTWVPIGSYPGVLLGCNCTAALINQGTQVWGSGPYTYDSNLCRAAVHSGAIPATGGMIWATTGGAQQSYVGTTRNGVTTNDYGPYPTTGIILNRPNAQIRPIALPACPGSMTNQAGPLTCHCAPSRFGTSGIWGTGTYTYDSNLCTAALHAGVVGDAGGPVSVRPIPDAGSYTGSIRNGVTSADYGAWQGAFVFE